MACLWLINGGYHNCLLTGLILREGSKDAKSPGLERMFSAAGEGNFRFFFAKNGGTVVVFLDVSEDVQGFVCFFVETKIPGCRFGLESSRQTLVSPIFISTRTICGGLFPKMYRGQICEKLKKIWWQLRVSGSVVTKSRIPRQHHCCGFKTFARHGNDTYTCKYICIYM